MRKYCTLIILFAGLWLVGCSDDVTPQPDPVDADPKTFIMFGNIGDGSFTTNVRDAGQAVAAGALIEGQRIIVCHEKLGSGGKIAQNIIYEIVRDRSVADGYRCDTLKVYKGENVRSTLDPDDMKYLLEEMRDLAPANHYGLALGSHGTGWIAKDRNVDGSRPRAAASQFEELWAPKDENSLTRYLGHTDVYGNNYRIDISDFAASVGSMEWDFVLLDACLMGSVEAVYEMRKTAPYLIVSPTEILMKGFPYDRVVKVLFDDWTNLAGVCAAYMDCYSDAGTISLVDTGELEGLAATVRAIRVDGYNDVDPTVAGIQYFEGLPNHVFYDLNEYMKHWGRSTYLYDQFYEQLQKVLPYTDCASSFYSDLGSSGYIKIHQYSGLTAFIPYTGKEDLFAGYYETEWYKAIYL